ncbi:hypothetical protein Acr_07g0014540 [Actinidia rufa]|uniref:Intracellular protein transporter n=1 Tax=Actinidia rufa TaxID=165716 RepID=A0A7J0EXW2_9ERIC|nr:hypothetical protein Acr_07g0014540 [Actinidia rufa]
MKPRPSEGPRAQSSKSFQGEGSNWILIAGGALLSTLSFRLGYKLKQVLDAKQPQDTCNGLKGNGNSADRKMLGGCQLHSNGLYLKLHVLLSLASPSRVMLASFPLWNLTKDSVVVWASSPDRLEPLQKPFHHSNCSDSPCVSESGSDIFSKREVIQKLRQQLKRRDDMILEMQDQIVELQSSLSSQVSHSSHMQSLLDAANRDLLDSEREIQRLRKAIADHCVGQVGPNDNPSTVPIWPHEGRNGHANGYLYGENGFDCSEKGRGDGERIEMLKREVVELKEVIEGKEYLLQNYKGQKAELSVKVKELQLRLDNQLPNIL